MAYVETVPDKGTVRKASRESWIAGAFEALQTGGIDALRVEPLALQLGVTKGSFYHHFENRRDLHLAMLEAWEQAGTSAIIAAIDQHAEESTPVERLHRLAERTMVPDHFSDSIENGIRAWARTDPVVAEVAARVDARRVDYAAALLRASGLSPAVARRRAQLFYRVLIGEFMWRSSGGPTATAREIRETVELLVAPGR